jgi:queuine tRNA-ribosyltransferase
MLLTWHNLAYYQDLMQGLRTAVVGERVSAHAREALALYSGGDIAHES